MMEDDFITAPVDYSGGFASVTNEPGWGVDPEEKALKKYATGLTVKIETK